MSDETETTGEVARVLYEHTIEAVEITPQGDYLVCTRCGGLAMGITGPQHHAAMLAEAGLLRDQAVIAERDMLKRGGAELGRQIERYLTWVLDATGMHHLIDEDGDGDWELVWERLAEMGRAWKERAQIAASVPAGQPSAGSAGRGGSGGSCARCGAGITLPADDPENREMAVCAPCEIAVLKEGWQEARVQVAGLEHANAALQENLRAAEHRLRRFGDDHPLGKVVGVMRECGTEHYRNEEGA